MLTLFISYRKIFSWKRKIFYKVKKTGVFAFEVTQYYVALLVKLYFQNSLQNVTIYGTIFIIFCTFLMNKIITLTAPESAVIVNIKHFLEAKIEHATKH